MVKSRMTPISLRRLLVLIRLVVVLAAVPVMVHAAPEGRPCKAEPTAETMQYGDLITCAIDPLGDSDKFSFAGGASEKIRILATRVGGGIFFQPCLQLFGPDGAPMGTACADSNRNSLDITLKLTGSHTILVSDRSNDATGQYTLTLERLVPLTGRETPIIHGTTLGNQASDPLGDMDIYVLGGAKNDRISIVATRATGGIFFQPCLELFAPDGTPIATACADSNRNGIEIVLTQDGNHALLVADRSVDAIGTFTLTLQCIVGRCPPPDGSPPLQLAASVLPSGRSVQTSAPATAFATILNPGATTAVGVKIALAETPALVTSNPGESDRVTAVQLPVTFSYQETDPLTNVPRGPLNPAVDIPPGEGRTFVIVFVPQGEIPPTDVQLVFAGTNTSAATSISGVNTLQLSAAKDPVPDIIALASTLTGDGILTVPGAGTGAFAVATVNNGAGASITATAVAGSGSGLPVSIRLCRTDPATAQCISALDSSVTTQIDAGQTPTFSIFATASGPVPFDPAVNRIFVRFTDAGGALRGSTSVAVRNQ